MALSKRSIELFRALIEQENTDGVALVEASLNGMPVPVVCVAVDAGETLGLFPQCIILTEDSPIWDRFMLTLDGAVTVDTGIHDLSPSETMASLGFPAKKET